MNICNFATLSDWSIKTSRPHMCRLWRHMHQSIVHDLSSIPSSHNVVTHLKAPQYPLPCSDLIDSTSDPSSSFSFPLYSKKGIKAFLSLGNLSPNVSLFQAKPLIALGSKFAAVFTAKRNGGASTAVGHAASGITDVMSRPRAG